MSEVMNYFIFMDGRDIIALAEAQEGRHTTELLQDHSELQAWPLPKVVYDYMETVLNGAETESSIVQMARKFGEDLVRITKEQEARRVTGNIPEVNPPLKGVIPHIPDPRTVGAAGLSAEQVQGLPPWQQNILALENARRWEANEGVHNPQEAQPDSQGVTGEDRGPGAAQQD